MRILLTGASGLVGAAFARHAAASGQTVTGVVGRWAAPVPGTVRLLTVDLGDAAAAARLVEQQRADLVVNAAAVSEPTACLQDPAGSQRVNVDLPAALAAAAARTGARFLHLSSEQVFDGEHGPFAPASPVNPLNLYGRQKHESERRVLAAAPLAAVVRLPLLFGNSLGGRRSVHEKLFEQWAAGRVASLFADEWRQVCTADSVAAMLLALAPRPDLHGVFHWAGAQRVSRLAMGEAICAHLGVSSRWIRSQSRAELPEVTSTRPRDLSLDLAPLDRELGLRPETLAEAVGPLRRPAWAADLAL